MRLTIKRIEKLRQRPGRYLDEHGLVLEVFSPRAASWFLRYQRKGRERWLGLGPLHAFGLLAARERARRARGLLAEGIDPLEARRAAAARSVSFADCAQQYYDAHAPGWSNAKHKAQFMNTMREYVFPRIGALPVATIDEALVLSVLRPLWLDKNNTAGRVRSRIERVLNFAAAAKLRSADNPARWNILRHLLPRGEKVVAVKHMPALPYRELPAFMARLRAISGVGARALEFTILTAARTAEVVGASWTEIDFAAAVWTIPPGRMKARKEQRVPLAPRALALLRELPTERDNPFVFVGARPGRSIGDLAMLRTLRALEPRAVVHGFRSCFSDWAHECSAFAPHVIEQALAHVVGGAVARSYRRGDALDKRRKLMNDWARYCESTPAAKSEVVPLRSARS